MSLLFQEHNADTGKSSTIPKDHDSACSQPSRTLEASALSVSDPSFITMYQHQDPLPSYRSSFCLLYLSRVSTSRSAALRLLPGFVSDSSLPRLFLNLVLRNMLTKTR